MPESTPRISFVPARLARTARLATAAALLSLACAPSARAEVGVALTVGLSGVGLDAAVNVNDYFGLRATAAGLSLSHNGGYGTSVAWDARLKLLQAGLLADVYPFGGLFHLTAGAVHDGNRITLHGQPTGASFTFNGNSYPSSQVGPADASVDWGKTVPYAGLGWGSLGGTAGWHFLTDFGVLFSGKPRATLAVACNSGGSTPVNCAQVATDVAAEQAKLQNDVNKISIWPVARIGIGYSF